MIISTINLRGLGKSPKFPALRCLFSTIHPDLVLVQETMAKASKACNYFLRLFPGWEVCVVDAVGRSGGLLCIWNPDVCDLSPFSLRSGILLVGRLKGCSEIIKIINIYGPFRDREGFWDQLADSGLLRDGHVILGGDLKFTLSTKEFWGHSH